MPKNTLSWIPLLALLAPGCQLQPFPAGTPLERQFTFYSSAPEGGNPRKIQDVRVGVSGLAEPGLGILRVEVVLFEDRNRDGQFQPEERIQFARAEFGRPSAYAAFGTFTLANEIRFPMFRAEVETTQGTVEHLWEPGN
ncbi:MAG: hypothetical protein ACE5H3_08425 [Planctomycetota bacterium]